MQLNKQPEIVVVGAGVIGLCCARQLARSGRRVAVVETTKRGAKTSQAAAGMLAPLAEVAGRDDLLTEIGLAGLALWEDFATELVEETGLDIDYDSSGAILPALDETGLEFVDTVATAAELWEEPYERLDRQLVRSALPSLSESAVSALHLSHEARVSSVRLVEALRQSCETLSVPIHTQRPVVAIEPHASGVTLQGHQWRLQAENVLVTAGAGTSRLSMPHPLPVRPIRGQMIAYQKIGWDFSGAIRTAACYAVRRHGTELLVGATVEDVGFDDTTTLEAHHHLSTEAQRLFPVLSARSPADHWAGLRPETPDHLPIIGRHEDSTLFFAAGHHRNGILLAPLTAEIVNALYEGSEPPIGGETLRSIGPDRFSGPPPEPPTSPVDLASV